MNGRAEGTLFASPSGMDRYAVFSPCRRYRYELGQIWAGEENVAVFVGLNPSTANEHVDDPTIRRCIRFARDWGYGGLVMLNLFALVSRGERPHVAAACPRGWRGGGRLGCVPKGQRARAAGDRLGHARQLHRARPDEGWPPAPPAVHACRLSSARPADDDPRPVPCCPTTRRGGRLGA
jgi:hypothetical protein